MEKLKPIETMWDGHWFRSRLEARWAVLLDDLGIEYVYEPEGFKLPSGRKYLPDFFIPEFRTDDPAIENARGDVYIEVKGNIDRDLDGVSRAREFESCLPGDKFFLLVSAKDLEIDPRIRVYAADKQWDTIMKTRFYQIMWPLKVTAGRMEHAMLAATQARFEHGEAPMPRRKILADYAKRTREVEQTMKQMGYR